MHVTASSTTLCLCTHQDTPDAEADPKGEGKASLGVEAVFVSKRLSRAWSLSGRRGLSRGPQVSGTPGPDEQKSSPQHREDSPEEGVAQPPAGLKGTASGAPGSVPGVSGPGFPSMLESCQETAAPKDEHSQDAAPLELNQSWETAPMEEISSSDSELSEGSSAGPDLPVRLSQISIASNMDRHDPWGHVNPKPSPIILIVPNPSAMIVL